MSREVQAALARMGDEDHVRYVEDLRRRERAGRGAGDEPEGALADWLRDDPGSPLGSGYPTGTTLRRDGQTHREAWMTVVRRDPCAYCGRLPRHTAIVPGAQPPNGTVDHIEPKHHPARGLGGHHSWVNFTGACASCNQHKSANDLLSFLSSRPSRMAARGRHVRDRLQRAV